MQDENVTCRSLSKISLSFERAVGCFGTSQIERATRFLLFQLKHTTMTYIFIQCIICARRQGVAKACALWSRLLTKSQQVWWVNEWKEVHWVQSEMQNLENEPPVMLPCLHKKHRCCMAKSLTSRKGVIPHQITKFSGNPTWPVSDDSEKNTKNTLSNVF